ncbi:hypothetical protein DLH72_02630 [Candidatus Gracilibacteria bacterium]|nr:MAG: hypothetical protein DLH72_02630 [Candidatus Gracilibacteria bacterium]
MKDKLFCDFADGNGNWISSYDLIAKQFLSFHNFLHDESRGKFWDYIYSLFMNDNINILYANNFIAHIIYALSSHSFINIFYIIGYFGQGTHVEATIFHWIFLYVFGVFTGFLIDWFFYYIGRFLSNKLFFKNLNYDFPKFFYIFFRFIPLIGAFSVLIGSTLTDKHDFKKDITKILIGNILFIFVSFCLGLTIFLICGRFH